LEKASYEGLLRSYYTPASCKNNHKKVYNIREYTESAIGKAIKIKPELVAKA
jgi:hypothetical protein